MPFVVDNSVVVAWFFPSQATDYTDSVLDRLKADTAHVPALWRLQENVVCPRFLHARFLHEQHPFPANRDRDQPCSTAHGRARYL